MAMKPVVKTLTRSPTATIIPIQPRLGSNSNSLAQLTLKLDQLVLIALRRWSITALRLALGSVFFWFGALKIFGASPVTLLIQETYTFLPVNPFVLVLGVWEMLIGIGIILKRALRCALVLLGVHLLGTFASLWLNPSLFFVKGLPLCLTSDGEFVIKNLVMITAALVIAGHELKPLRES
jgi:uncharacterized membrane protein YkgB